MFHRFIRLRWAPPPKEHGSDSESLDDLEEGLTDGVTEQSVSVPQTRPRRQSILRMELRFAASTRFLVAWTARVFSPLVCIVWMRQRKSIRHSHSDRLSDAKLSQVDGSRPGTADHPAAGARQAPKPPPSSDYRRRERQCVRHVLYLNDFSAPCVFHT